MWRYNSHAACCRTCARSPSRRRTPTPLMVGGRRQGLPRESLAVHGQLYPGDGRTPFWTQGVWFGHKDPISDTRTHGVLVSKMGSWCWSWCAVPWCCALRVALCCALCVASCCALCAVLYANCARALSHCHGAVRCALRTVLLVHPGAVPCLPFPVPLHPPLPALPALWGGRGGGTGSQWERGRLPP